MNRADGILMAIAGLIAIADCVGLFIVTEKARATLPEFHAFSFGFEFCAVLMGSAGLAAVIFGLFHALSRGNVGD